MGKRASKRSPVAETALRRVRDICLSLPDTTESTHFGEPAFYVRKKLFATCGEKDGPCRITFGLEPEHADALIESDPRYQYYGRTPGRGARRSAPTGVWIEAADVDNWEELRVLILEGYRLQAPRASSGRRGPRAKTTLRPGRE